ncbi:MAG: hypothetical protein ACLPSO_00030 [Terracidiphilus sp.]
MTEDAPKGLLQTQQNLQEEKPDRTEGLKPGIKSGPPEAEFVQQAIEPAWFIVLTRWRKEQDKEK